MEFLLIYLLIINAAAFILMLVDKRRAQKNLWRIPEKALFLSALLGGSLGAMAGMYTFRHKPKHFSFVLGIPAIMAAHIMAAIYLFMR